MRRSLNGNNPNRVRSDLLEEWEVTEYLDNVVTAWPRGGIAPTCDPKPRENALDYVSDWLEEILK